MDIKKWARDFVTQARRAGSTTAIARAAVQATGDVVTVMASRNAALTFQSNYLPAAALSAGVELKQYPGSPAITVKRPDGTSHLVFVVVAGSETRGLPNMPILFDPAVVHLVAAFGRDGAGWRDRLAEVAAFGATAGAAGAVGYLLRPTLSRWAIGAAIAAGVVMPTVRALRRLRRR